MTSSSTNITTVSSNSARKRKTPDDTTPIEIAAHKCKRFRLSNIALTLPENSDLIIIFVTGNPGKLREVQEYLGPQLGKYLINYNIDIEEIQSSSPKEILTVKLRDAIKVVEKQLQSQKSNDNESIDDAKDENGSKTKNIWILVEDTSLSFDYLSTDSHFYPGPFIKFAIKAGLQRLLHAHEGLKDGERNCTALCTFGLQKIFSANSEPLFVEGKCKGEISKEIMGDNGFGWDPIFFYPSKKKSFAQMSTAEKNVISHRAMALKELKPLIEKLVVQLNINQI